MANLAGGVNSSTPLVPSPQHSSLCHMPHAKWQFDEDVTDVFDDMLARSIPQIETMRELVSQTAKRFVQPDTVILDFGCSLGAALAPLVQQFRATNRFVGVEASAPMVTACRERFKEEVDAGIVEIRESDLRQAHLSVDASVTLCVLTLMFVPIEHRFRILADVFAHTRPGGAFILVEKVLGADAELDGLLTSLYWDHKRGMGYTDEAIDRKRLALEGVLVPVTANWNEQMLRGTGFHHVECFWRCMNFAGWVAIKS
jgi:tRNA (cmo5U34)-methyltransferase